MITQNIKARKREELLSKKRRDEEEREAFVKEMAEKKAAERAEVVQQARKLLLQKKPLCRRINRALLVSEVFSFERIARVIPRSADSSLIKLKTQSFVISSVSRGTRRASGVPEDY